MEVTAPFEDAPYPQRRYAWAVVAILIGTAILSYTDRQVLSLLVDPVRRDLDISDTEVSLLLGTAFAVVYGLAGIPFGLLADRTSRRNLILAGVLMWSLGTVACGFAHSFGQLFTARIVVGLGESVLSPAAISLISDYFPPARRGMAVGCFLSGIAMGSGAAILIGGGVLQLVERGALAATPLAAFGAWRLVLLLIGAPGFAWALLILLIREPARRVAAASASTGGPPGYNALVRMAPVYFVVATASLVDNALGTWAPTLFIRTFGRDPAQVGLELGLLLTVGFGGGVLAGGALADLVGGRWRHKLVVCLVASVLIPLVALVIGTQGVALVMAAVPAYFTLSGIVTACGFSAILDAVPNRMRGFAMAFSFFLNVAFGAGLGPTAVPLVAAHLFGPRAGLAPPLAVTVATGYVLVGIALAVTLTLLPRRSAATAS